MDLQSKIHTGYRVKRKRSEMTKRLVMIKGGLGNQMSQFAFYLSIKNKFKESVFALNMCTEREHNGFELQRVFPSINARFINSQLYYFIARLVATNRLPFFFTRVKAYFREIGIYWINESYDYSFKEIVYKYCQAKIVFYLGGWHCEKYFDEIKSTIKEVFKFDLKRVSKINLDLIGEMAIRQSVAIHIRRGDYYTVGSVLFGGVCNIDYYKNSIKIINDLVENPEYYIFSDDPDWVRDNLKIEARFVSGNSGANSWQDMLLMSSCKHNIICNSSFSWWGAWLNSNPNKIIVCPKKFIATEIDTEVYPESWIKVN